VSFKAIILTGHLDFGRCPIASQLQTALWPIVDRTAIELLLVSLEQQGIRHASICSSGDIDMLKQMTDVVKRMEVNIVEEPLPVGTAGAVRDAAGVGDSDEPFLVVPATIVCPPIFESLVEAHKNSGCGLTIVLNPAAGDDIPETASGIFICNREILQYIPMQGYCDIKEGVIPQMLRHGKIVNFVRLPRGVYNFRDRRGYLRAVAGYLNSKTEPACDIGLQSKFDGQKLWISPDALISPEAYISGPVAVMSGAEISGDAVIFGPAVIGRDCRIGESCLVTDSVLWEGVRVEPKCDIRDCLIDAYTTVPAGSVVVNESVSFKKNKTVTRMEDITLRTTKDVAIGLHDLFRRTTGGFIDDKSGLTSAMKNNGLYLFATGFVFVAFLWSYWPGIVDLWNIWQRSDEYSSGILVPFLAIYILWSRREQFKGIPIKPSLWGVFALLFAEGLRSFGLFFMYGSAERFSVVVGISALVLFLLGWQFFKKTATVLLFLCLMLPWPNRVQAAVALPLQSWATSSAVFCLETIGYNVVREGNVIHIGQASVAVAEACNGLRMITAFFVISGLVVLLAKRPRWEKIVVLISSLPIAMVCNTTRLVITAMAFTVVKGDYWEKIFHDFGGYAMMPLALAAVVGEFWLLRRLTVFPAEQKAVIISRQ
jgi:exosortase